MNIGDRKSQVSQDWENPKTFISHYTADVESGDSSLEELQQRKALYENTGGTSNIRYQAICTTISRLTQQ